MEQDTVSKKGSDPILLKRGLTPLFFAGVCVFLAAVLSGCGPVTYPEARCKEALQEIAAQEYGIPHIDVEFAGKTLGVFLPLDKLFEADLKDALMSGKVTDMESLFQPTEDAIDKVEDILFSMSRVMLSTDKKLEFYYLQATDVEQSGMDLTFVGQIDDLKRVRFWDIPRSEYRKRIIHDLHTNRAALWHRPVRHFFRDLNEAPLDDIQKRYFTNTAPSKWEKEFFLTDAEGPGTSENRPKWTVLDLKSIPLQDHEIVVYAKVQVAPKGAASQPKTKEYLFQISTADDTEKIRRIIPMAYLNDQAVAPDFTFTRDMIMKNLSSWETEFQVPDITPGGFFARQFTRRFQMIAAEDERIGNTFSSVKLVVRFDPKPEPGFLFDAVASLQNPKEIAYTPQKGTHEDVLYFWDRMTREFVEVLRGYGFQDYKSLKFQLSQGDKMLTWVATREELELFRRHKKSIPQILTPAAESD